MGRIRHPLSFVLCCCWIIVLAGCNGIPSTPPPMTSVTPPGGNGSGTPLENLYLVVSGWATDSEWSPDTIFVFSQTVTGEFGDQQPHWEIAGSQISLDSLGNLYVLTDHEIDVIPPIAPYLERSRNLPIGPGTKIAAVNDMVASLTGEIFISDGSGIAVFGPTATGNADPVRYILGNTQSGGGASTSIVPGLIAVDAADNLYVQNTVDSSIDVFGPTNTGTVIPSRTIAGPLARLTSNGSQITAMTTDGAANLYVLCLCSRQDSSGTDFEVLEFSPTANGNIAPIRFVTTPAMNSNYFGSGVAVDSAGTIYVSGGAGTGTQVFEFSATASGSVAPSNTVTSTYGGALSGIAVQ
jgi:hypothetical protein